MDVAKHSQTASRVLYKRLIGYAWPYRYGFGVALIAMALVAFADVYFVRLLQRIIDGGFVERDSVFLSTLPFVLVGLFTLRGVASFVSTYLMTWVSRKTIFDLRQAYFDHAVRLPASYFDHNASARTTSRLVYDVEQVANAATGAVRVLVQDLLTVIALLGWMIYLNWRLSIVFLVAIPFFAGITRAATKRFRKTNRAIQQGVGGIAHVAEEAFNGHRVVKTYGGYEHERVRFRRENNYNRNQMMKRAIVQAASLGMTLLVSGIAIAIIIYLATSNTWQTNLSAGNFVSYLGAIILLMSPIKRLGQVNDSIQSGVAAVEGIFNILDAPIERDEGTKYVEMRQSPIFFDSVSFRYPGVEAAAVDSVSFTIEPGQTIALVGPSGSGKSTLSTLLLRLYMPDDGAIRIGNTDINDVKLDNLRSQIALVTQDTVMFDDSIRNNIAYGQQHVDEALLAEVVSAAHVAEFSDRLADGLETRVGEQGTRLSGGQRQRVAIARALYKNAPLLILDEATSALDNTSERLVQEAIDTLIKNRTTLIIAHRLSTIEAADRIIVMDRGRIVESGNHTELMALNGLYYGLYRAAERQDGAEASI